MTVPFVTLLALLATGLADAAGPKPLTTEDLFKLRTVGEVAASPDGRRIAYTVQSYDRPGRPYSQIWVTEPANGARVQVTRGDDTGWSPRWSHDSQRIAFIGEHDGQRGLFIVRPDGSELKRAASVEGTNHPLPSTGSEISWAPDNRRIAYVSATRGPEVSTADPVVITRYLYKPPAASTDAKFNDNRRLHIFVVDLATGAVRQLTGGNAYEHSLDWSPRGEEILFVSNREPDPDRVFNDDIFVINAQTGSVRRLTNTPSAEYDPVWSPDGARLAFLGTHRSLTSSETTMEDTHVSFMDADGDGRRELTPTIDNRHGSPQWSFDGSTLVFAVQQQGSSCLYAQAVDGTGAKPVTTCLGTVGGWSVLPDGVAFAWTTPRAPAELFYTRGEIFTPGAAAASAPLRLTSLNEDLLAQRAIARPLTLPFKSFDGLPIEAFVTEPLGLDPSRKYPLVVMIHGGPHGQQGPAFNTKAQIYAGAGLASLMVNYRGSTGYGQKFADAIFGDQNGGEAKDVLGGVSAALARYPWLDRDAVFVEGMSYGGQLTNWLVTQTDRFKAAVSSAGISNLVSFNYMAYYHDYLAVEFGAYPHEGGVIDKLWERSPIRYAKDVKTPVLFLHGEDDNDVPIAEAEQFYLALKDVGVETMMIRYPREGHGLRETKHVADAIDRTIVWYRKHLPVRK